VAEDAEGRRQLAARFLESQKSVQDDPWTARAEGAEKHEFTVLKQVG
jgi:nitrite reductase (NADH) large subunit